MISSADLIHTLQTIPWFLGLKPAQLEKLAELAILHEVSEGEDLFSEGDRLDYLYILLEGQMEIEMSVPTRGKLKIFTAEALDIIGWSILTPVVRQRTGSARALENSTLLAMPGDALQQLCDDDPEIGYRMMRRVANVAASRFLVTRLQLLDMIVQDTGEIQSLKS